jgi:serine/threonine-protein kinase
MNGFSEQQIERIQLQLDRILASASFSGSERHRKFLRFVVERALAGDTDKLNEFVLGFEVFNKSESFDPRIDSIVRVEARRLRERLKKYYEEEGAGDTVVVTLRPRSFVPEFTEPAAAGTKAQPAGPRRWLRSHRVLAAVVVVLLLAVVGLSALLWRTRMGPPPPPPSVTVAVTPFRPLTAGSEQEMLGAAIADSIITGLANVPGLRILASAAAAQADYLVEGSLQVKDNRLRVSVKMTDRRAQTYIWAETREADVKSRRELEFGLTNAIAGRLRVPLPPAGGELVMRRRASSPEAYGIFLKAQYYWYQNEPGSTQQSIHLLQKVTQMDPNFAPAWAWLSQGYQLLVLRDDGRDASLIAQGRQAAAKALALDDQLAEANAAVASYAALDWDWKGAEKGFRRAIQLNPTWAQGHLMYAIMYLLPTGQLREAQWETFRAHELDPFTRLTRAMLANVLYYNREYDRAISESEDLAKPGSGPSHASRAYYFSLSLSGKGARALAELRAANPSPEVPPMASMLAYLEARHGDRAKARAALEHLAAANANPVMLASIAMGLGEKDRAMGYLQEALRHHAPMLANVAVDPVFDPLSKDTRFVELLRTVGATGRN